MTSSRSAASSCGPTSSWSRNAEPASIRPESIRPDSIRPESIRAWARRGMPGRSRTGHSTAVGVAYQPLPAVANHAPPAIYTAPVVAGYLGEPASRSRAPVARETAREPRESREALRETREVPRGPRRSASRGRAARPFGTPARSARSRGCGNPASRVSCERPGRTTGPARTGQGTTGQGDDRPRDVAPAGPAGAAQPGLARPPRRGAQSGYLQGDMVPSDPAPTPPRTVAAAAAVAPARGRPRKSARWERQAPRPGPAWAPAWAPPVQAGWPRLCSGLSGQGSPRSASLQRPPALRWQPHRPRPATSPSASPSEGSRSPKPSRPPTEARSSCGSVARDAPALWLEAVLARKPRMPSDLEARLLQGSRLPIDFLLHDLRNSGTRCVAASGSRLSALAGKHQECADCPAASMGRVSEEW